MSAADQYFKRLEAIQGALSLYQYDKALHLAYESLPLVPGFITSWRREYGQFDITSIPCIEVAARFSAAQGDVPRIEQLRAWAAAIPDLAPWLATIEKRIDAARVQGRVLEYLRDQPGVLQNALPKALGVSGQVTSHLVVDMEHLGLLQRVPSGKSYALFLAGAVPAEYVPEPAVSKAARVVPVEVLDPSDTWVAIDFETATSEMHSACCLGVAVIEHGAIVSSGSWLIQPPGNRYDRENTHIHGINPRHTKRAPTYADLYPTLVPFLEGRCLLAHWADFDVSVLRAVHAYYGIPLPSTRYACSCRMAQRTFPGLQNHKLPTVCGHCGIPLRHHDASSDALACAQIALTCRDAAGCASVHEVVSTLGLQLRDL